MKKRRRPGRFRRRFRTYGFAVISYSLFGVAGILAFFVPSPSLKGQGGPAVLYLWGGVCLVGSVAALVGQLWQVGVAKLLGAAFCSAASLIWCVALVLQTVKSGNIAALSAACLVGALTGLLAQRWSDVSHPPDE